MRITNYSYFFQWLGFVLTCSLSWIMTCVFFFGAPYLLKPEPAEEPNPEDAVEIVPFSKKLKTVFAKVWKILSRPTFIFLVLALAFDGQTFSVNTFMPKYLENNFQYTTMGAGLSFAPTVLIPTLVGPLVGSIIMERLKLGRTGAIKLYVIAIFLAMVCSLGFLINCPQMPFGGITFEPKVNKSKFDMEDLHVSCNVACQCSNNYEPICGDNGIEYFNPCYAGCQAREKVEAEKTFVNPDDQYKFSNCTCINETTAKSGICKPDCSNSIFFLIVMALMYTFNGMPTKPVINAIELTVKSGDETFVSKKTTVGSRLGGPSNIGNEGSLGLSLFVRHCSRKSNFSNIYIYANFLLFRRLACTSACGGCSESSPAPRSAAFWLMKPASSSTKPADSTVTTITRCT